MKGEIVIKATENKEEFFTDSNIEMYVNMDACPAEMIYLATEFVEALAEKSPDDELFKAFVINRLLGEESKFLYSLLKDIDKTMTEIS